MLNRGTAIALCSLLTSMPALGAESLRAQLERETSLLRQLLEVSTKIERLDREMSALEDRQRSVLDQLNDARRRYQALKRQLEQRKQSLRLRLRALYKLSRGGHLRLALAATSPQDFNARVAAIGRLVRRDLLELRNFRQAHKRLKERAEQLAQTHQKLRTISASLNQHREQQDNTRTAHRRLLRRVRASRTAAAQLKAELDHNERYLLMRLMALRRKARLPTGSEFSRLRGVLPWPVRGAIVTPIAAKDEAELIGDRPGTTFRPRVAAAVRAVADGTVAAVENIAAYGRVVLVAHRDQYFSLYGFLSHVAVKTGAPIRQRELIGRAGIDPLDGQPAVYFELRHGTHALAPLRWLAKSSRKHDR
ncbi:MAG: peptidoglycan DD-metalloendopeptidase family protein [Deltaproteobacteria bacterium]|nr:peptidoglycan DD-metalloendopeptidase family protein [Deltaproteobacteria bacterium]